MGFTVGVTTFTNEVSFQDINAVELQLGGSSMKVGSTTARFFANQLLLAADFIDGKFLPDDVEEAKDKE
jgi:hypothetical protein